MIFEIIEFRDDENDDLLEYLSSMGNTGIPKVASRNAEKSLNPKKKGSKRKISAVDLHEDDTPTKGIDSKFIFINKRARTTEDKNQRLQDNLKLKNEILELQKRLLLQEIQAKSEINKLTIENLKIAPQLAQQKLEANVIVDDYDY